MAYIWKDFNKNKILNIMNKRKYRNEEFLKDFSLSKDLIDFSKDVIILPHGNLMQKQSVHKNAFPDSSYFFKEQIEEHELSVDFYNSKATKRDLVLRSAEYVFPFLLLLSEPAISITINIISSIIYDRFLRGGLKEQSSEIRIEYAIYNDQKNLTKYQVIEGDANKVLKILKHDPYYKQCQKKNKYKDNSSTARTDPYKEESKEFFKRALTQIAEAELFMRQGLLDASEQLFRRGLTNLCNAYLYDRSQIEYRIHLHRIGANIRTHFGCTYNFENGIYENFCPVLKSHGQGGFSIGGTGEKYCLLCKQEYYKCQHKGKIVDNVTANKDNGICNICGSRDCLHQAGSIYNNVKPIYSYKNFVLDHIAYVKNPADPTFVYFDGSLDETEVLNNLPERDKEFFIYGKSVLYCNHCNTCDGS